MENRPDYSEYLVHFTKGSRPCSRSMFNPTIEVTKKINARDKLINILRTKTILASRLPWVNLNAVCFTECVWGSLLAHASYYSCYAIGFKKQYIFQQGGNPVFYIRPTLFEKQQWDNSLKLFTTPFKPSYSDFSEDLPNGPKKTLDFSHEREWRIPENLKFTYNDIEFVIVKSSQDLIHFKELVNLVGEKKFLFMDNYAKIEQYWPVHKVRDFNLH